VLYHMIDGVYAYLPGQEPEEPPLYSFHKQGAPTSSYNSLMRLSTLDDSVQDALMTHAKLTEQINTLISQNKASLDANPEVAQSKEYLAATKRYITYEKKHLKAAQNRRAELQESLRSRREEMQKGREAQDKAAEYLTGATSKISESHRLVKDTESEIQGQRRRICEDLLLIYPIEDIPNQPLNFKIRGLALPNSTSPTSTVDEEATAAALGHISQIVHLLSLYLFVALPYPVTPNSSTSLIHDPISLLPGNPSPSVTGTGKKAQGPRTFPLYPRHSVQYRFDYAVFLLNKDIEALMSAAGLKVMDLRQTLPNLYYLLAVLSAGPGDIPERLRPRAGGARGLREVFGSGSPSLSRRTSEDNAGDEIRKRVGGIVDGVGAGRLIKGAESSSFASFKPQGAFRRSGLNEMTR
jgi:UV radiation resistance-associated gene protein